MRLSWFIFVSTVVTANQSPSGWKQNWHGAQICPSTPLAAQPECSRTQLNDIIGASGSNINSTRQREPDQGWTGPHRCAGNYCLYACRGFAGGRGMVVITTPKNLQRVKTVEKVLQESGIGGKSSTPPFRVAEVDGKGLGMIANTTLARGYAVMTQTPVLLAHRNFIEGVSLDEQHKLLDTVPGFLPAATRKTFMGQMGHFGGHKVTDILATNSFQMDLGGNDGHHYGNFPEVSRYNHDCRPNVAFYIGPDLVHRTTAVRPVKPGEELTISYLDPLAPRAMRQSRARMTWGFDCGCSQCSLPHNLAAQSDQRLMEIDQLERQLLDFGAKVTTATISRFLKLHTEERLESRLAGAYTTAALNYSLLGKRKEAVKYAKLAVEAAEIESGPGAGDVESMRSLAADPKKHFTWRGRLR